jgi:hypothetical protein
LELSGLKQDIYRDLTFGKDNSEGKTFENFEKENC